MNRSTTVGPLDRELDPSEMSSPGTERRSMADHWRRRYQLVRRFTEQICLPLETEDFVVQSMPDASPVRWHLAHTTWFFETFLLRQQSWYRVWNRHYEQLFNSYYNGVGKPFPRHQRGLLTRPTVKEVYSYRRHVDDAMDHWLSLFDGDDSGSGDPADADGGEAQRLLSVLEIGTHHEQQHQELILTDLKHALSLNPLFPVLEDWVLADQKFGDDDAAHSDADDSAFSLSVPDSASWVSIDGGIHAVGHGERGFAYDNEFPRHEVLEESFEIGRDLVTNGQWIEFIEAGGYQHPAPWLSMGWDWVSREGITAPLYWHFVDGQWHHFTYAGLQPVDPDGVVTHVSYFEADAFARWAGARLPTESQWEIAAGGEEVDGPFADRLLANGCAIHPTTVPVPPGMHGPQGEHDDDSGGSSDSESASELRNLYGTVWQWTSSPYTAYPGYRAPPGTLGEYNGKFMCNQFVLRGGSCATPSDHVRPTYRNFFPPDCRWQFTGLRLAR